MVMTQTSDDQSLPIPPTLHLAALRIGSPPASKVALLALLDDTALDWSSPHPEASGVKAMCYSYSDFTTWRESYELWSLMPESFVL